MMKLILIFSLFSSPVLAEMDHKDPAKEKVSPPTSLTEATTACEVCPSRTTSGDILSSQASVEKTVKALLSTGNLEDSQESTK